MDDPLELIRGDDESLNRVLGLYDTPAYVRRGLQLAESIQRVYERCAAVRAEVLSGVQLQLRILRRSIRDLSDLRPYVPTEEDLAAIAQVGDAAGVPLVSGSGSPDAPASNRLLRAQLRRLVASIERFNRRWNRYLAELDLSEANARVADYNRYYLLEKECALRSARLAARGFHAACEIRCEQLTERFPSLPSPRLL